MPTTNWSQSTEITEQLEKFSNHFGFWTHFWHRAEKVFLLRLKKTFVDSDFDSFFKFLCQTIEYLAFRYSALKLLYKLCFRFFGSSRRFFNFFGISFISIFEWLWMFCKFSSFFVHFFFNIFSCLLKVSQPPHFRRFK